MMVAVLMVIAGRVLLTRKDCEFVAEGGGGNVVIGTALKRNVNSSLILLKRIVVIALPVSIMAFVLIDLEGIRCPARVSWLDADTSRGTGGGTAGTYRSNGSVHHACRFDGCRYPGLQAGSPDATGGTSSGESSIHPCAQAAVLFLVLLFSVVANGSPLAYVEKRGAPI
ncbi:MAG: hypothetical protein U9N12_01570 [Euryarchaeota archaeon]|nr:hypothetical protein [Euryarchaeota archaeon]